MPSGWTRIDIVGKPADVFNPGPGSLPFWLVFLHDESGQVPDAAFTAELAARRLRCVSPLAGRSWWVDRACPEFDPTLTAERHVRDNVVPWVVCHRKPGPRGYAVCGVGMGGQGAVRLGFRHPKALPIVASIAGAFDFHDRWGAGTPLDDMYPSREYARQDTAVLHVDAHHWPPHVWFACPPGHAHWRGNDRLHEKLAAMGVPHTCDLDTPGEPADFYAPMLDGVVAALERESRRLM